MSPQLDNVDVVVIGSGVAGALVAKTLAQQNMKVCILEAGTAWTRTEALQQYHSSINRTLASPFPQAAWLLNPSQDAYFAQQGNTSYRPHFIQGVGGTTWNWTGITPRFLPNDFRLKSKYGIATDWPITYTDLETFYVQAEHTLGVAGDSLHHHGSPRSEAYPMPAIPMSYADQVIAKKLSRQGLSVAPFPAARNSKDYDNRPACRGNNTCSPLCPTGASYSANTDIQKAVEAGAQLIKEAVVFKLDVGEDNHISAAHYKHPDGSIHQIKGKKFILACNAIETPRLLLMSKNKLYPTGIANTSGQVGRNLMDHCILTWKFNMPEPVFLGRGPQSISTILHGRDGAFRRKHAAIKFFLGNDLNIHMEAAQLLKHDKNWLPIVDKLKEHATFQAQIGFEIEQLPLTSNRIHLNWQRLDPLGLPLPYVDYNLHAYTEKGIKIWRAYTEKLIQHLGAEITASTLTLSSHHPSGTTRMGHDNKDSVVNEHCQSHDHKNLYIIGSSVFPTQGTANPTLTIAALSLRLAQYIKKNANT